MNERQTAGLPGTLDYPGAFARSPSAGFDGAFHWEWVNECFPNPKDTLMDIDGFKDRRGQMLVFESKDPGVEIKQGQMIGLKTLHKTGVVAVMLVWGKEAPQHGEFWFPGSSKTVEWAGVIEAQDLVRRWYNWADSGGRKGR